MKETWLKKIDGWAVWDLQVRVRAQKCMRKSCGEGKTKKWLQTVMDLHHYTSS